MTHVDCFASRHIGQIRQLKVLFLEIYHVHLGCCEYPAKIRNACGRSSRRLRYH